ncbi:MAG: DNA primase, partial [Beijerinckiaceae bacterium]|nr:DNA primase [Beijerinckiaceae bacterium]
FFVNDHKMAWFDFSAGKNGNIFDFLIQAEGISFPEAVERLARQAGLPLPQTSPEAEAREKVRASLHEVLELAATYFSARLSSREGSAARAYLAGRAIDGDLQTCFRLGYALPGKYGVRDYLAGKGVSRQAMIDAGLLIHGGDIAVPYDRFRDRIIFPICDPLGRVIAFGGRALANDAQQKYLNSPETELFHKGAILYNHHNARKAARENGQLILVEGYVDVIAMTSAGFEATVAPLGTALTPDHCELLWKMAEEPILCFDGDRAGRKAAYRVAGMALPLIGPGRSLSFALLPEGEDPDELVRSGGGAAVSQLLTRILPLSDLIWIRETEGKIFATPERRAGLERRLNEFAREIRDEALRRHYHADIRSRLFQFFGRGGNRPFPGERRSARPDGPISLWQRSSEPGSNLAAPPAVSQALANSQLLCPGKSRVPPREGLILLLLLNHPGLIGRYVEELSEAEFSSPEAGALRDALIAVSQALPGDAAIAPRTDVPSIRASLESQGFGPVLRKLGQMAAHGSHWYAKADAAEADAEEVLKQALNLHRRARALHKELQLAELALGKDSSEANLGRLKDIQAQLSALGGIEAATESFGVQSGRPNGTL